MSVTVASASKETTKGEGRDRPFGSDSMGAAVRALSPEARAVLVILEPDEDGLMDYIVEYAGPDYEKSIDWYRVLGVLQAGTAKVMADMMIAPTDYEERTEEPPEEIDATVEEPDEDTDEEAPGVDVEVELDDEAEA